MRRGRQIDIFTIEISKKKEQKFQIDPQEYPEFWPTEGKDLESETFRVRSCGIKETASGMILREVAVRSLQDDYELSAKIVQGPRSQPGFWPHNANPRPLVTLIHDLHRDYQNGPIVVMDR